MAESEDLVGRISPRRPFSNGFISAFTARGLLIEGCALLVLAAPAIRGADGAAPNAEDSGSKVVALQPGGPRDRGPGRALLYPRLVPFWSFSTGPTYGFVAPDQRESSDVIFSRVGSFETPGPGLPIPLELRATGHGDGIAYYLVQFRPEAFALSRREHSLSEVEKTGAELLDYVPNSAYIMRADGPSLKRLQASGLLQYIAPYHPAYKLAPTLGEAPLPDPEAAASSRYSLIVTGFRGVGAGALKSWIEAQGGIVTAVFEGEQGPTALASLERDRIVPLARTEGIRSIDENIPGAPQGEEISWNVIAGIYAIGTRPPLYLAGVNGSGRYLNDIDTAPLSGASPPIAGPEDMDWNGNGILDNAAQILALTDTGVAVDAGDFSETAFSSGWNGNGGTAGPNVPRRGDGLTGRNHRKLAWYEIAPGGFGSGDTTTCGVAGSHGHIVAAVALGNASSGPFAPPNGPASDAVDWSGDGTPDDYGDPNPGDTCGPGFCFHSGGIDYRVDGAAPGARLVVQDINATCPEPTSFPIGSYMTLLTDARGKGARIHELAIGAFNGTATQYDTSAASIDGFLSTDANGDYMLFLAAGNYGSATPGGDPAVGRSRSLVNEASAKNAITIGGDLSGASSVLRTRAPFSSIGPAPDGFLCSNQSPTNPAPSDCGRIKPDLMAPAMDGGGAGLPEAYTCSGGGDQVGPVQCFQAGFGQSGTSIAVSAAAGAGALVRDYFASGLFPDGTASNAGNDADRKPRMSGALLKALLVASAEDLTGSNLHPGYGHRYNPETGYGFIDLAKVLPLTVSASSPSGLLVHDAGCPAGQSCPSTLSLPASLATGTTAADQFEVTNAGEELRVALTWVEPADGLGAGTLVNDLNLELRYCGPDRNCTTAGGTCAGGPTPGAACTGDTACAPSLGGLCDMDRIWFGNAFTEDTNDDGIEDQDLDGTPGLTPAGAFGHWRSEGSWSLPNRDTDADGTDDDGAGDGEVLAARDTRDTVEAIYLSPDPEGDGTGAGHTADAQIRTGRWQVRVSHTLTGPAAQKYALAIAGGVSGASSIRLDTSPLTCNGDVALRVDEIPGAPTADPGCNTTSCPDTVIESRTRLTVRTAGGAQVDMEPSINLTKDPGTTSFRSGRIPVSTAANADAADGILLAGQGYIVTATYTDIDCNADGTSGCQGTPAENVVRTSQTNFDCTAALSFSVIPQPGRDFPFRLQGGCDDDPYLDSGETFSYLVHFVNLELERTLDDVIVTLRAVVPDGDDATDPGRLNNSPSPYVSVPSPLQHAGPVAPGAGESIGFALNVQNTATWPPSPAAPPEVELVVGVSAPGSGLSSPAYSAFRHLLSADDETFLYSTDYPTGAIVDRDINANEAIENPIHDARDPYPACPAGTASCYDGLKESIQFSDLTTVAFGGGNPGFNGPWDFDTSDDAFRSGLWAGSTGNISEITNWGEDHDYDGSLSGPYVCAGNPATLCSCAGGPSDGCFTSIPSCPQQNCQGGSAAGSACNADSACPGGRCARRCVHREDYDGDQDGTLDEGWGTRGGCGYVSHDGSSDGAWHTGQIGPVGATTCSSRTFPQNPAGAAPACEAIDIVPGTSGQNTWIEFLRTPVIQKVHRNADARGLDYRVALVDWRWNLNADIQPNLAALTWEFDEDTESPEPVDLGDSYVGSRVATGLGPIRGTITTDVPAFPMFVAHDPDDDTAPFGQKALPGQLGRKRSADRGCMFETLTAAQTSATNRPVRTPAPADDDCDNDIVSLGPDGCPGRCNYDDDGDGVADNPEEACPCFSRPDGIDDDGDARVDEPDELQRYYRCRTGVCTGGSNPGAACTQASDCLGGGICVQTSCTVTGVNTDTCGANGPCGRYGNGKPAPYGDDVCGDGSIDEGVSEKWAAETALGENGHRIAQTQNWPQGVNYRINPIEDAYDTPPGNSFQGAIGFAVYEGTPSLAPLPTYGAAIDDMTIEWSESHPVAQAALAGCGGGTCSGGPRTGKLCFNSDDCGPGVSCSTASGPGASCASLAWGESSLDAGSGSVRLILTDFNAQTTQGGFDCTAYGYMSGCGSCVPQSGCSGTCAGSNDCDGDGLTEVEVQVRSASESEPERFRLEQTGPGSTAYTGTVPLSSTLDAPGDGIVFLQYDGIGTPTATASYFDRDSGGGDLNGDGTPDGPPNNGRDGCPGACGVDDDGDGDGPDNRPGLALTDDDGNGVCDKRSANPGQFCTVASNCPGGVCLNIDELDEECGRVCVGGTGLCSAASGNAGAVCANPGTTSTCTSGGTCIAANCSRDADCPGGGTCTASFVQRGDDDCSKVDEQDEQCAIVSGALAPGIDDNCGCASNPVTATLATQFDVADLIVAHAVVHDSAPDGNGDGDGIPDDHELVSLALTLRNLSSFDVDNVVARLTTRDATVACIGDPESRYGRINALQAVTNGTDTLKFTVGDASRASLAEVKQARFLVTVHGDAILPDGSRRPFYGTAVPQSITFDLDFDSSAAAPPPGKSTRLFTFEAAQYANDAAFNADWLHTFQSDQPGMHCQYNAPGRPHTSTSPSGCYLRQDTPGLTVDDWHLHSPVHAGGVPDGGRDSGAPGSCSGGKSPGASCQSSTDCAGACLGGKVPGEACTGQPTDCRGGCQGNGNVRCSINVECQAQGLGKCNNPIPGTCTNPAPGACAGLGSASLHLGVHRGGVELDAYSPDNIMTAQYRPTLSLGLGRPGTDDPPEIDLWQQVSLLDDRLIAQLSPPDTLDAAVVQVLVDRNNDGTAAVGPPSDPTKDGWWETIVPFYGLPVQQRIPGGLCRFDPVDDGSAESDLDADSPDPGYFPQGAAVGPSSTCFPEFVWGCAGDTQDAPYDPSTSVEPGAHCFPEVDSSGAPVVREGSGPGRWVQAKFDLYRYRGRQIWFRFLQSGTPDLYSGFICDPGPCNNSGGNRDDGWYIDDVKLTGLTAAPATLRADTDPPPASSCPASHCTTIAAHFSGSTYLTRTNGLDDDADGSIDEPDEGSFGSAASDAPLRNIALNAQDPANPTTSDCSGGSLQYRFWVDADGNAAADPSEIIRDYSEDPQTIANSAGSEVILMNVRCAAPAPNGCTGSASTSLSVTVGGQVGGLPSARFAGAEGSPPAPCASGASVRPGDCFEWCPVGQTGTYDVATRQSVPATTASSAAWLGAGGYFDTFACSANGLVCMDANADGLCEFDTTSQGTPPAGTLDLWLVRQTSGSWQESGSTGLTGPTVTRDTRMISDGGPVCP